MFCQFFKFVLLLILGCVLNPLISVSWSSQIKPQDEISMQQDRLSSLPTDVMPLIFEHLDDATLSQITGLSKKYKQFTNLTELIFQQRSDFKEVLPLVFPEGNPWKHSYFLRKGFWKFLLDYKSTLYQNISDKEGAKLGRFNNYCVTHKFMASDLIFSILKTLTYDFKYSLLQEPETKDCLLNSDVNSSNHLAKFNQNIANAVSNQDMVGLEVGTYNHGCFRYFYQ